MTTDPDAGGKPRDFMRVVDALLDSVAMICRVITGLSLVGLTVIFGWLVYGRYVLNATPTWVEQVALLLVMVIAFIGAAVGVHEHTHLAVTGFRTLAPPWLRTVFVVVTDLLMAGFGLLMLIYGARLTAFKWDSMIPLIHVPEGLRSLPLTIGGGLITVFALAHLLRLALGRDLRSDIIS
ncbi:TRAP transporter small permease [Ponticoccus alexandrii]|uniref:TRAP transporter small permease protein n=1 Tax=Ponticoccus alexandrii TaxID=1943633 RepID=A0ABX7F8V6_9RHOB|nr:TRAP transporter small permease [Ponticoccus alexandrii]QRF65802.1 TRAP transporter small permease subunit [Ponticoccus alexandrii]